MRFVEGKEWHLFVTIPIDDCPEDDELLRRLRRIEAELCKNYIAKRYHHLPDQHRFSMVVGIEGEQTKGTRHAHTLIFIPACTPKRKVPHAMLLATVSMDFQFLWWRFSRTQKYRLHPWSIEKQLFPWEIGEARYEKLKTIDQAPPLKISTANTTTKIYTTKLVREDEVPWSRFEFVTPPKFGIFDNKNLKVIRHRDRQRRKALFGRTNGKMPDK